MDEQDPLQEVKANGVEREPNGARPAISEEEATAAFLATGEMLRKLFADDLKRAEEEFDRRFPYLRVPRS
jgi:hypothetical protein